MLTAGERHIWLVDATARATARAMLENGHSPGGGVA